MKILIVCKFCTEKVPLPDQQQSLCSECGVRHCLYDSYESMQAASFMLEETVSTNPIEEPAPVGNDLAKEESRNSKNLKISPVQRVISGIVLITGLLGYYLVSSVFPNTPESAVTDFLEQLGEQDYAGAWKETTQTGRFSSEDKFISPEQYGGIVSTKIIDIKVVEQSDRRAIIRVDYEADDPLNTGQGRYKQNFTLVKQGNSWKIVDLENIKVVHY